MSAVEQMGIQHHVQSIKLQMTFKLFNSEMCVFLSMCKPEFVATLQLENAFSR